MDVLVLIVSLWGFLLLIILGIDLIEERVIIMKFFKYRMWRNRDASLELDHHNKPFPVVQLGKDAYAVIGENKRKVDIWVRWEGRLTHIPVFAFFHPISSLCMYIAKIRYHDKLKQAQQLIDL